MADNRERARALRFYKLPLRFEERGETYYVMDAAGQAVAMMMWAKHDAADTDAATAETEALARVFADAAFSRGSASIADEATVERVARAITEHLVREGDTYQFARLNADGSLTLDGDFDPKDIAEAALAALAAPPAPLKEQR